MLELPIDLRSIYETEDRDYLVWLGHLVKRKGDILRQRQSQRK